MQNKTIGVFFGSRTPEHDISIITAQLIISGLRGLEFNVVPVYIDKKGKWLIGEELGDLKIFSKGEEIDAKYSKYYLDMEGSFGKMVFKKKGIKKKTVVINIAFPAFHGSFGEDGTFQGVLEMLNIPYIGCDTASSAVCMDKALTKQVYQTENIPTTKFVCFKSKEWQENKSTILNKIKDNFNWPVFVKPVHLGSSIAIAKVKDQDISTLENKIEVALYYDNKVLVEEAVPNLMDVTCCVIGNEELKASLLQESVFQSDLFDFNEKYLKEGGSQLGKSQSGVVIPARLDESTTNAIRKMAMKAYRVLDCSGIARIDFLFNKETKEFFVNEVNPLPGTIYHHLWQKSGLSLSDLLSKLIELAVEKHKQKQNVNYTFNSGVLNNIGTKKLKLKL